MEDEHIAALKWVVFVQRMSTLCVHCRQPAPIDTDRIAPLLRRVADAEDGELCIDSVYSAPGCQFCDGTGRLGDVAAFDIFRAPSASDTIAAPASLLSLERYALGLAELGYLALDDVIHLDADYLRRTYALLSANERALATANGALERRLLELNAAHEVLQQRTAALISLQEMSQALIASTDLGELVARVCRQACTLCGADRAILYLLRSDGAAEILAVNGWEAELVHQSVEGALLAGASRGEPESFRDFPPGVPARHADVEGATLRAGLLMPLVAEHEVVGAMIVHTTRHDRFTPGEAALLQTLANQAALSIQRAALIERLREKISALEEAQAALVHQQRLEREMELAREVQQSVLPRVFPEAVGYVFAARNQPARRVGGDFYDVFALDDNHIGLVIADVSDKGMPAALYMALTRSLLLAEARREPSPRAVLLNVNRLLRELGDPHMFVTVFYGVLALREQRMTFARAGHDYPLLLRAGAATRLGGSGTVLGAFDSGELRLSQEELALRDGDKLVLYTDGLTDILDPTGNRLELGRLTALILAHAAKPPAALCDAVFAQLAAYQSSAEQFDDMTLVAVAVDGES
jgi:serine phosphatase RsbU (regulator of sigma subunit)